MKGQQVEYWDSKAETRRVGYVLGPFTPNNYTWMDAEGAYRVIDKRVAKHCFRVLGSGA